MLPIQLSRGRPAGLVLMITIGVSMLAGPSVVAARPAEGGRNASTHQLLGPAKRTTKCRICAGSRCTVVSVKGRCTKRRAVAALRLRLKRRPQRRMPITPPVLDDRSYGQLQDETRRRVPRHTPEWSDHNDSDPGIMILETARRNPRSIRVQPVSGQRSMIPEVDDEVMPLFEHGEPRRNSK